MTYHASDYYLKVKEETGVESEVAAAILALAVAITSLNGDSHSLAEAILSLAGEISGLKEGGKI